MSDVGSAHPGAGENNVVSNINFSPFLKEEGNKQAQNGGGHNAGPKLSWYIVFMVGSVGKGCSEVDKAYIAGLFDCDGAIMATIESHREKKFGFRVRVILKVTQKKTEILEYICATLGVGKIQKNRTTFDWVLKDQQTCKEVLKIVTRYIKGKSSQVRLALEILSTPILSKEDLLHVALLADTLSGFNVRSFGRRKNYALKIQEHTSSND